MDTIKCSECNSELEIGTATQEEYPGLEVVWCEECTEYMLYQKGDTVTLFSIFDLDKFIDAVLDNNTVVFISSADPAHGWMIMEEHGTLAGFGVHVEGGSIKDMFTELNDKYRLEAINYFITKRKNENGGSIVVSEEKA